MTFWNVSGRNLNCYVTYKVLVQAYVLFKVLLYAVITDDGSCFVLHCLKVMLVEKILCFLQSREPSGGRTLPLNDCVCA